MTPEDEPTKRFPSASEGGDDNHTLGELFKLVQSMNGELKSLRADFEQYKIRTTPVSETLEAIRVEVKAIAERQDGFGKEMAEMRGEMAEMKKVIRRVETKLDGFSLLLPEMQGTLHDHAVRLLALESK